MCTQTVRQWASCLEWALNMTDNIICVAVNDADVAKAIQHLAQQLKLDASFDQLGQLQVSLHCSAKFQVFRLSINLLHQSHQTCLEYQLSLKL